MFDPSFDFKTMLYSKTVLDDSSPSHPLHTIVLDAR
jgi:hypothetical protein